MKNLFLDAKRPLLITLFVRLKLHSACWAPILPQCSVVLYSDKHSMWNVGKLLIKKPLGEFRLSTTDDALKYVFEHKNVEY